MSASGSNPGPSSSSTPFPSAAGPSKHTTGTTPPKPKDTTSFDDAASTYSTTAPSFLSTFSSRAPLLKNKFGLSSTTPSSSTATATATATAFPKGAASSNDATNNNNNTKDDNKDNKKAQKDLLRSQIQMGI